LDQEIGEDDIMMSFIIYRLHLIFGTLIMSRRMVCAGFVTSCSEKTRSTYHIIVGKSVGEGTSWETYA
jgi:hypothetical protein